MSNTPNIAPLFPKKLKTYCCRIKDYTDTLYPEELNIIHKAIDKRRNEFSTGRFCIRKALSLLKTPATMILQKKNGEPVWPENITGSVSHSFNWAGAAAAKADEIYATGVDIETIARISKNILKRISTVKENALLQKKNAEESQIYAALVFSAKEAFYKALSSRYPKILKFRDISIIPEPGNTSFKIVLNPELKFFLKNMPSPFCRTMIYGNEIFTAITFKKTISKRQMS